MDFKRGSWRGRGRGRGRASWAGPRPIYPSRPEEPRPPSPLVGSVLQRLMVKDLSVSADGQNHIPAISNCQYVGSYNWVDGDERPTILIPGEYFLVAARQ